MLRSIPAISALLLGTFLLAGLAVTPARADILELTDGRIVEGDVIRGEETYLVRSRFGVVEVPVGEVKSLTEAPPLDTQIREHLATLDADDMENRALLSRWLRDIGRLDEADAMAEAVLEADPENAVAHEVLGHIRHRGVWRTPDEAKRAEGFERHGDRWYTPQEWANVEDNARLEALEQERRAEAERLAAEVNRAVRLMTSPAQALRERGRAQLETLAAEYDNPRLLALARDVDAYVRKADELAAAAASLPPGGGTGTVLGEIRATVSKLKRPIETFETSLASNIGGAPVRIQLPEVEVIRVRTTAPIPVVVR
ncbi:MAG: hypothetical protein ACYTG6_05640 [Planctomycetota bacterium]|jgi:hypothetical protein